MQENFHVHVKNLLHEVEVYIEVEATEHLQLYTQSRATFFHILCLFVLVILPKLFLHFKFDQRLVLIWLLFLFFFCFEYFLRYYRFSSQSLKFNIVFMQFSYGLFCLRIVNLKFSKHQLNLCYRFLRFPRIIRKLQLQPPDCSFNYASSLLLSQQLKCQFRHMNLGLNILPIHLLPRNLIFFINLLSH